MFSYTFYKIIHISSIVLFFSSSSIRMLTDDKDKIAKILQGVTTLLILVSGMGLLARIGISHGQGWPNWAIYKVSIWLILGTVFPLISKRCSKYNRLAYWVGYLLLVIAIYIINEKPI